MANFHSDKWIMEQLHEHYEEAKTLVPENRIVGLFLQGSQNYEIDTKHSDIDTKLIVVPSLEDIIFNRKPMSTTHVRTNNEHIDIKDIRLYFQCFRKQNLNFLEILFTKYKILNPNYAQSWNRLIENNEAIANYDPVGAVKTMKGIALEKYHALEHPYPAKLEIIAKWGYDGKQLSHLVRVEEYLRRYINGELYKNCLITQQPEYLIGLKNQGYYSLDEAREVAKEYLDKVVATADEFCGDKKKGQEVDKQVEKLLDDVQRDIMKNVILQEFVDEALESIDKYLNQKEE